MTLFPERQEAIKVLYEAAGQLLDNSADYDSSIARQLNRQFAEHCVELAEKIGKMGPIIIHVNSGVVTDVEGVPFALGNVVKDHDQQEVGEVENLQKYGSAPDPDFDVADDKG